MNVIVWVGIARGLLFILMLWFDIMLGLMEDLCVDHNWSRRKIGKSIDQGWSCQFVIDFKKNVYYKRTKYNVKQLAKTYLLHK